MCSQELHPTQLAKDMGRHNCAAVYHQILYRPHDDNRAHSQNGSAQDQWWFTLVESWMLQSKPASIRVQIQVVIDRTVGLIWRAHHSLWLVPSMHWNWWWFCCTLFANPNCLRVSALGLLLLMEASGSIKVAHVYPIVKLLLMWKCLLLFCVG